MCSHVDTSSSAAGGDDDNEDHVPYSPMSQEAAQEEVGIVFSIRCLACDTESVTCHHDAAV